MKNSSRFLIHLGFILSLTHTIQIFAKCESEQAALTACQASTPSEVPCYLKPGTQNCDHWTSTYAFESGPGGCKCAHMQYQTRSCRSFDGCGNFKGQWQENDAGNILNCNADPAKCGLD